MAGLRRAIDLAIGEDDLTALRAIARSRTEQASRVERARMLLAYRDDPSFFAAGRRMGVHHQTVQRCVERAVAYGPLAALDDLQRPGRARRITAEAKAWIADLACRKAKELGYPHELWTTRLLARHARTHGPREGHACLATLAQGTLCNILNEREIKPHRVRYYLERRDPEFKQKMAEVLCVYREVKLIKEMAAAGQEELSDAVAIVSYDEKPGIQAMATTAPDSPPSPASTAAFARDHGLAPRHGQFAGRIDLLTGQVHALVKDRHRSRETVELSGFSTPAIRTIRRSSHPPTIIPRTSPRRQRRGSPISRRAVSNSPSPPSMAGGSTWSKVSSPARPLGLRHIHVASKQELKHRIMAAMDELPIAIPSFTLGHTGSTLPHDLIRNWKSMN